LALGALEHQCHHTHTMTHYSVAKTRCSLIWQPEPAGKKAYKHWGFTASEAVTAAGGFMSNEL